MSAINQNTLIADETAPSSTVSVPQIDQPTTLSSDQVANAAGALRSDVEVLSADVAEIHSQSLMNQLEARTDEAAKRAPADLLEELASNGFSWTGVAHLTGVSIPAIRKWRKGEPASGENRRRLAQIVAFVGVLEQDHLIADTASWLDVPLAGTVHRPLDLYAAGHIADLMEHAAEQLTGAGLLDRAVPDWRTDTSDEFEVFVAGDGERAIRPKAPGNEG